MEETHYFLFSNSFGFKQNSKHWCSSQLTDLDPIILGHKPIKLHTLASLCSPFIPNLSSLRGKQRRNICNYNVVKHYLPVTCFQLSGWNWGGWIETCQLANKAALPWGAEKSRQTGTTTKGGSCNWSVFSGDLVVMGAEISSCGHFLGLGSQYRAAVESNELSVYLL